MRLALLQFEPRFGDADENLSRIEKMCEGLRADVLVLPELCTTGYQFRDRNEVLELAEETDGPSVKRLAGLAGEIGGVVVAGFAERAEGGPFNSAAVVDARGLVGLYRKTHLFYREKEMFSPGDTGFRVFDAGPCRLGVMICFDWIFPESARTLAMAGAELIAHPANLVLPWCQKAMPIRSLENRIFCATANRTGTESRWPDEPLRFTGKSIVTAPDGTVLATAGEQEQTVIEVEIDPSLARNKAINPFNHLLNDRRPEFYG